MESMTHSISWGQGFQLQGLFEPTASRRAGLHQLDFQPPVYKMSQLMVQVWQVQ